MKYNDQDCVRKHSVLNIEDIFVVKIKGKMILLQNNCKTFDFFRGDSTLTANWVIGLLGRIVVCF